jgi:hypothetical protein
LPVVLGEVEHDRLAASAFAQEAVGMAVGGGSRYRNSGNSELVVKGLCSFRSCLLPHYALVAVKGVT